MWLGRRIATKVQERRAEKEAMRGGSERMGREEYATVEEETKRIVEGGEVEKDVWVDEKAFG